MRKSRYYLMKCLGFVLLFGFISLGAIGGCSNNNSGGQATTSATTALTENDFGTDLGLVANLEKHLIVKFLEHPSSEEAAPDTGEVGNDVIPVIHTHEHWNTPFAGKTTTLKQGILWSLMIPMVI